MKELEKVWNNAPKEIQELDTYCFYVSTYYRNMPNKFKGKKVIVSSQVPTGYIYYAEKDLLK
jgi:hypothetical protein